VRLLRTYLCLAERACQVTLLLILLWVTGFSASARSAWGERTGGSAILGCLGNGMASWTWSGLAGTKVRALAFSPIDPPVIYAGTQGAGIRKSSDDGVLWDDASMGLPNPNVLELVFDVQGNLYAATWGDGVYRLRSGTYQWEETGTGLACKHVYALACDGEGNIYAGTYSGVYRSADGGRSWLPCGLSEKVVRDLLVARGVLYAATLGHGVYVTHDGGATWAGINEGLGALRVYALAVDLNGEIYAGTSNGLYRYIPSQGSWDGMGLGAMEVYSIAADPSAAGTIYAGARPLYTIYLPLVFSHSVEPASLRKGEAYRRSVAGAAGRGRPVGPAGVYKTANGGRSWQLVGLEGLRVYTLVCRSAASLRLYAGTEDGVWYSGDVLAPTPTPTPATEWAVRGRVVDEESGQGLAGALLQASIWDGWAWHPVASAMSDSEGYYELRFNPGVDLVTFEVQHTPPPGYSPVRASSASGGQVIDSATIRFVSAPRGAYEGNDFYAAFEVTPTATSTATPTPTSTATPARGG